MARSIMLGALALACSACSAERSYVVRLDLEQIAHATAARDRAPGFATLRG